MNTNNEISATTVSFVSGRGGVGKTVISLSLEKFLSSLGDRKVLLIDFDLATNGASHFFRDKIKKKHKEAPSRKGIVELIERLSSLTDLAEDCLGRCFEVVLLDSDEIFLLLLIESPC